MAGVGSEPRGTRVVLFKQSSFLFSHHRRIGESRWRNTEKCLRNKRLFVCLFFPGQLFEWEVFPLILFVQGLNKKQEKGKRNVSEQQPLKTKYLTGNNGREGLQTETKKPAKRLTEQDR